MKNKGLGSVFLTGVIILVSISLVVGWSWHSTPSYSFESGNHIAAKAYYERKSGIIVEVSGKVVRVLEANREDPGLHWFQMRTPNGQRFMVAYDRDLFGSTPLLVSDDVTVRGEYEWTESGGTIHHARHDESLKRRHGWIEYKGKRYD